MYCRYKQTIWSDEDKSKTICTNRNSEFCDVYPFCGVCELYEESEVDEDE